MRKGERISYQKVPDVFNRLFAWLMKLRPWHFVILAIVFSEILTSLMSVLLRGRITYDYLVTGGVVSLIVASVVIYFVGHSNRLAFEKQYLEQEVAERRRAEERLRASLMEKEVLLRELHHRVKNNLQLISSLLNLQLEAAREGEASSMLMDARNRINSIVMAHNPLFGSQDLSEIDFAEYVRNLTAELFSSSPGRIALRTDLTELSLTPDTVVPCGLIINELVGNALRHAFPGGRRGEVAVSLGKGADGEVSIVIADNGVGIPRDVDVHHAESLGFRLVGALVRQLEGSLQYDTSHGTEVRIRFKA